MIETDRYALVQRLLHWLIKARRGDGPDEPLRMNLFG